MKRYAEKKRNYISRVVSLISNTVSKVLTKTEMADTDTLLRVVFNSKRENLISLLKMR